MGRKAHNFIDLTGQIFGRLRVIERAENNSGGQAMWKCVCLNDENTVIVMGNNLRRGLTKSCGCLMREIASENSKKHMLSETKVYSEWTNMKTRCYNQRHTQYKDYGGRGIRICDRWINDVQAFYDDVSVLPYFGEKGYTLNRIDNDGDYEPNNVQWDSAMAQNNNKRNNYLISYNGETHTIAEWARMKSIPYSMLYQRITRLHWNVEKALTFGVIK